MAACSKRGILLIVSKHFMIFILLLVLLQPLVVNAQELVANKVSELVLSDSQQEKNWLEITEQDSREIVITDDNLSCLKATLHFEEEYDIQQHLLTSISTVETGRWHNELNQKIAWPWSVNTQGKSYYFESKEEAVAAVKRFKKRGYKSIDVGCMQINLMYHGKAFSSIEDAFDPHKNVEYAAQFLTKLNKRRNEWLKAGTDYHSKKPSHAKKYKYKLMLAMIDVEEGHEIILDKYGVYPEDKNANPIIRWFANLFGASGSKEEVS